MSIVTPSSQTSSGKPPDLTSILSAVDKQVKATMLMKELLARIADVSSELKKLHEVFIESDNLSRDQKCILRSLKLTIIPFLLESSTKLIDASKVVAPISGLDYVHRRDESKRNRIIHDDGSLIKKCRKSSPLKRIKQLSSTFPFYPKL